MSRIVAIGDERRLAGYALAGVEVRPASSPAAVELAWADLVQDVALLVLTAEAHDALAPLLEARPELVWAVVPS